MKYTKLENILTNALNKLAAEDEQKHYEKNQKREDQLNAQISNWCSEQGLHGNLTLIEHIYSGKLTDKQLKKARLIFSEWEAGKPLSI